jgi:hypothetical protein
MKPWYNMKHMNTNRQQIQTLKSKKKKSFSNKNNRGNNNFSNNNNNKNNATFNRIFQSTTILSRSPSHSFSLPSPAQVNQLNTMNSNLNMNTQRINSFSKTAYRNNNYNNQYKKSKGIKISNNSINKGNIMNQAHQHHHHHQKQHYMNSNYHGSNYNNMNNASDIANNHLANMLHINSRLTHSTIVPSFSNKLKNTRKIMLIIRTS